MDLRIKNAFGKVGEYVSASSLNKWAGEYGCSGLWYLSYIAGKKFEGSPASIRGQAVEDIFEAILHDRYDTKDDYVKMCVDLFNDACDELEDINEKDRDKELQALEGYITQAIRAKEELSLERPFLMQKKVKTKISKYDIDLVGYVDFRYEFHDVEKNFSMDLKTTGRLPRKGIKPDHEQQISGYAKADGDKIAKILYLSPKDYMFYSMDQREIDAAFTRLEYKADNLYEILYAAIDLSFVRGTDPKYELANIISPDFNKFGWQDEELLFAKENKLFMFRDEE